MPVHPIHNHKNMIAKCAKILNEEWPRNLEIRITQLEKSCDELPTSLAFSNDTQKVVGHCRLCKVLGHDDCCYIESVVIKKKHRGKGYGKRLMKEAEIYAKSIGITVIYLTTHDVQDFYSSIGYVYCEPIVTMGMNSNNFCEDVKKMLESCFGQKNICISEMKKKERKPVEIKQASPSQVPPPPAPPPPPPAMSESTFFKEIRRLGKKEVKWMKKELL
ncbi:DgyrCDS10502 [Dimorphilus gyrociliatus]|uniref:DgyrCDS10502 n=1 Tax=Dimorphilus gyrociliatus TaxID=2664684 RepID=A0A7I8W0H5_9ANNE|nr:DgyrCDS10502 [Dimorphilus gyrociliatus]